MNGALDEWLSHRSAKPSTAVRIRQAPHFGKISTTPADIFLFYSQPVFLRSSVEISWGKGFPKESVLFLLTFKGKEANIWGKGWERLRESWLSFEGKEFHFILPAEILAYGTRAVSWLMFSPLSVTKWPTYHTIPSKFASNREILFCTNEPQKRKKASE